MKKELIMQVTIKVNENVLFYTIIKWVIQGNWRESISKCTAQ